MHFMVNNVSLDFCLDKFGLTQDEKNHWIERIRDDFNEPVDNNKIVKLLLNLPRNRLQAIGDATVTELVNTLQAQDTLQQKELTIRLTMFAAIIDNDAVNYQRFIQSRNNEPNVMDRYDYCFFTPDHLVVMFEEFDE